jgi:hypothetical protein
MSTNVDSGTSSLGTRWMVASGVGGAVGLPAGAALASVVRFPLANVVQGLLTVALFGAIFGLGMGLAQALARPQLLDLAPWALLSGLGGALGYALGVKVATAVSDPLSGNVTVYLSEGLGYLVFGGVLGLLVGLAQTLAWRKGTVSQGAWIGASVIGIAVGTLIAGGTGALLSFFPIEPLRQALYGALVALSPGIATHVMARLRL